MHPANYRGLYINLDRSTDRRARLEANLADLGIFDRYVRFGAVEGASLPAPLGTLTPGEAGCFASHLEVLNRHRGVHEPLHILEDDVILAPQFDASIRRLLSQGVLDRSDLVFTETFVRPDPWSLRAYKAFYDANVELPCGGGHASVRRFALFDLKNRSLAGTTSYFVAPRSIDRLHTVLRREWEAGPQRPLDLVLRDRVDAGELTAAVIFPFVTTIKNDDVFHSTLARPGADDLGRVATDLLRRAFFIECDVREAESIAEMLEATYAGDPQFRLIVAALGFTASPKFKPF